MRGLGKVGTFRGWGVRCWWRMDGCMGVFLRDGDWEGLGGRGRGGDEGDG